MYVSHEIIMEPIEKNLWNKAPITLPRLEEGIAYQKLLQALYMRCRDRSFLSSSSKKIQQTVDLNLLSEEGIVITLIKRGYRGSDTSSNLMRNMLRCIISFIKFKSGPMIY